MERYDLASITNILGQTGISFYSVKTLGDVILPLLSFVVFLNILLAVFNLIPIPPLDGSKILLTLLPSRYERFAFWLQQNGSFLLIGLLIFMYASDSAFFERIINFFLNVLFSLALA